MKMNTADKMKTVQELTVLVLEIKAQGRKVVTTNGCFDILHPGHVESFEWAKDQGDALIVGINSDRSVRENKGTARPIVSEDDRARVLAALQAVDYVFIFDEESPRSWLSILRPDVHVKGEGSEESLAFVPEKQAVEEGGGEVRLAPRFPGRSTTGIIETVLERYRQ